MRTANVVELRLWATAVLCALAVLALGAAVASRTPTRVDVEAGALRGMATPLAFFFTALGRWPVLLGLAVVTTVAAASLRLHLTGFIVLFAAQVLSQAANAGLKLLFHRARPDAWLGVQERDLSYPSGHAVTAVVFFTGLAILVWQSPLPRPFAVATVSVLAVCALGIPWSRLALGAHYLTDVTGGLLLGASFLCAAFAVLPHVQRVS